MITVRGPTTGAGSGGFTLALPSGTVENDFLLLVTESNGVDVVAPPDGTWTEFSTSPQIGGTTTTRLTAFWKIAGAAEPGATLADPGDHLVGALFSFNGVELTGTIGWSDGANEDTSDNSVNWAGLGSGVIGAGDFVIFIGCTGTDSTTGQLSSASMTGVEEFIRGSVNTNAIGGGGLYWIGGRSISGGAADASGTLVSNSPKGLISLSLIELDDPNEYVQSEQLVTVVNQHESDQMLQSAQLLTVVDQMGLNEVVHSMQLITVVIEPQDNRRKNFMSFVP